MVLRAYGEAAAATSEIAPDCEGMRWSILAGIGHVESHHGTLNGSQVGQDGVATPPIIGPELNGGEFAAIPDTDGGRYDRNPVWDHAVGPMQFIPATWESTAPQANEVDNPDPQNIFHATRAAVSYLCGPGSTNLNDPDELNASLLRYNQSQTYADQVAAHIDEYDAIDVPAAPAATGEVPQAGTKVPCSNLGAMHPYACTLHDHLHETFGAFYLTVGGVRARGPGETLNNHHTGEALDYMMAEHGQVPTPEMQASAVTVVNYVVANHEQFNILGILWDERLWNPLRHPVGEWSDEITDFAGNRGSITEDHIDHIHISVGSDRFR